MSEQPGQISHPLTSRAERKELLVLACAVDRAGWVRACRPSRSPAARLARQALAFIEPFSVFLPGKLGRMVRGGGFLLQVGRQLGWI